MKLCSKLSAIIFLAFVSCSWPDGSGDEIKNAAPRKESYFPLAVGNTWYYASYEVDGPIDLSTYHSSWQVVSKIEIGSDEFFGVRRAVYGSDTTVIISLDTTYYAVLNDSLYQIDPHMPLVRSSIHLRAVFCDSGYAVFTWNTDGDLYEASLNGRTDTTMTYSYWKPDYMDSGYEMTYQKGVGCCDTHSGWGLGSRLAKYSLKK